jgi:hypothetical protein
LNSEMTDTHKDTQWIMQKHGNQLTKYKQIGDLSVLKITKIDRQKLSIFICFYRIIIG